MTLSDRLERLAAEATPELLRVRLTAVHSLDADGALVAELLHALPTFLAALREQEKKQ
jgi:hypothetical protein